MVDLDQAVQYISNNNFLILHDSSVCVCVTRTPCHQLLTTYLAVVGVILCVVFVMFLKSVFHSIFRSLSFLNSSSLRHQQLSVAILSLHVMLQKADTILLLCAWPTFECSILYYNKKFIKFFSVESGLECVFWGENVENAVQMWSMWNKFHV